MDCSFIEFEGINLKIYCFNTIIVGTGAAGLNAALRLYNFGQKDIAIVTEGLHKGTSRNTGSDKQTYYKLTLGGDESDSVYEMANTLFNGGSMHGDIALVEAALSPQCFYHLVEMGIPFPHNRFGEYIGYKTDHDPKYRATSAGPFTSKYMTISLEKKIKQEGIKIFDGYQVISILTDKEQRKAIGLLTLNLNDIENPHERYVLFNCTNIIYATGGPAGMYLSSVYPESQSGASGLAFEIGAKGRNLTESQFGIASRKFRWNLSGTYQQVIPRYISTDLNGNDEKEFLNKYFSNKNSIINAIFLKGYQWPFDPRKTKNEGSSLIDLLVYNESVLKGRRVFLDYTKNPKVATKNEEFDFSLLCKESFIYLKNSNALFGKPIDRLKLMNQPAVDLFKENGIDLEKEYLEIGVCAQHNNGGLCGDIWWQSNIKCFFPVGEVNGTHGVYRPGGSALNSGQVGGTRAAKYISMMYKDSPLKVNEFIEIAGEQVRKKMKMGERFLKSLGSDSNVMGIRREIGSLMDNCGGIIRDLNIIQDGIKNARANLKSLVYRTRISSLSELAQAFQNYDLSLTQYIYLSSINDYIKKGGKSRGSYIIFYPYGEINLTNISELFKFSIDEGYFNKKIQEVVYNNGKCEFEWIDVNPLPNSEKWFENVWNTYMKNEYF